MARRRTSSSSSGTSDDPGGAGPRRPAARPRRARSRRSRSNRPEARNAQRPADVGGHRARSSRSSTSRCGSSYSVAPAARSRPVSTSWLLDPAQPDEEGNFIATLALDDQAIIDQIDVYQRPFAMLADPRFVTIAVVEGHAIGAGFQLALCCDLRIVADDARFCMKEPALGLVPDLVGTKPLVAAVGYARALEICASARNVSGAEAGEIGLAQVVVPAGRARRRARRDPRCDHRAPARSRHRDQGAAPGRTRADARGAAARGANRSGRPLPRPRRGVRAEHGGVSGAARCAGSAQRAWQNGTCGLDASGLGRALLPVSAVSRGVRVVERTQGPRCGARAPFHRRPDRSGHSSGQRESRRSPAGVCRGRRRRTAPQVVPGAPRRPRHHRRDARERASRRRDEHAQDRHRQHGEEGCLPRRPRREEGRCRPPRRRPRRRRPAGQEGGACEEGRAGARRLPRRRPPTAAPARGAGHRPRRQEDPARPPRRAVREGRQGRPDDRRGREGGRVGIVRRLRRRRHRRARAAGHGRRRDRRPGQGLPQADRQGAAPQRRDGGLARQADRGRPVRRREARRGAARSPPSSSRSWSGSPRTAAAPRTTCSRPTSASSSRWPSATPAAACCSWT